MSAYYFASRYTRKGELQLYATALRRRGHEVTSRWIDGAHELIGYDTREGDPWEHKDIRQQWAQECLDDIRDADTVLMFTTSPDQYGTRGGYMWEAGYAYGLKKKLWVIGPRHSIFCDLAGISHAQDWPTFLRYIGGSPLAEAAKGWGELQHEGDAPAEDPAGKSGDVQPQLGAGSGSTAAVRPFRIIGGQLESMDPAVPEGGHQEDDPRQG